MAGAGVHGVSGSEYNNHTHRQHNNTFGTTPQTTGTAQTPQKQHGTWHGCEGLAILRETRESQNTSTTTTLACGVGCVRVAADEKKQTQGKRQHYAGKYRSSTNTTTHGPVTGGRLEVGGGGRWGPRTHPTPIPPHPIDQRGETDMTMTMTKHERRTQHKQTQQGRAGQGRAQGGTRRAGLGWGEACTHGRTKQ